MKNVIETTGWKMLSWGAACAVPAMIFLKIVANEIQRTDQDLDDLEYHCKEEEQKRIEMEQEMMTVQAGKSSRSSKSSR